MYFPLLVILLNTTILNTRGSDTNSVKRISNGEKKILSADETKSAGEVDQIQNVSRTFGEFNDLADTVYYLNYSLSNVYGAKDVKSVSHVTDEAKALVKNSTDKLDLIGISAGDHYKTSLKIQLDKIDKEKTVNDFNYSLSNVFGAEDVKSVSHVTDEAKSLVKNSTDKLDFIGIPTEYRYKTLVKRQLDQTDKKEKANDSNYSPSNVYGVKHLKNVSHVTNEATILVKNSKDKQDFIGISTENRYKTLVKRQLDQTNIETTTQELSNNSGNKTDVTESYDEHTTIGEMVEHTTPYWYVPREKILYETTKFGQRDSCNVYSYPKLSFKNCIFTTSKFIECKFIGIARDYVPFVSYNFYLEFTITFKMLMDKCNGSVQPELQKEGVSEFNYTEDNGRLVNDTLSPLRLWKVEVHKVAGDYRPTNFTTREMGPHWLLFLALNLDYFFWNMHFSADVAVGILHIAPDCFRKKSYDSTCIEEVEFLNFPKILGYTQGYQPDFWEAFQSMAIGTLGGHNGNLTLRFKEHSNVESELYIVPLLNGTAVTWLSLSGYYNWGEVKPPPVILPHVKHLDLSNNGITDLNSDNIKKSPNVEYLVLSSNKLQYIPETITSLTHLKHLDISGNPIQYNSQFTSIPRKLTNLKSLMLSGTEITSKYLNSLLGPNSTSHIQLHTLDISNCSISSLDDLHIFDEQKSLQNINLAGNKIRTIPPRLFSTLHQLKYLNLSSLYLTEGPKLDLGFGTFLEYIDLSHNNLTSPNVLVSGKVSVLDMSYNEIQSWSDETIFTIFSNNCDGFPKCNASDTVSSTLVDKLNLSYNVMLTVTKPMRISMTPLHLVDLGENPFNCLDCETPDFRTWLQYLDNDTSSVRVISLNDDELYCYDSENGTKIAIRDVDFISEVCFKKEINYPLVLGVVFGSLILLICVITLLILRYKFEITYLIFLLRQRRKRESIKSDGTFEYDAFVCYSRLDRDWVTKEMVPSLEESSEHFRLCLHERDFILGSFISLNIINSVQSSRYTILVLTSNFIRSQWCRWELEVANHKLFESGREFLILLELERLDEKIIPPHLKYLMDTRTYLEWPENGADTSAAWKRLKTCLGQSLHMQEKEKQDDDHTDDTVL